MRILFLLLAVGVATPSHANYLCTGKVSYLGSSTVLSVSNGFGIHNLCSVSEDKCKLWASMILAAKMSDKTISIYYQNTGSATGDQSNGICNDLGNWVTPTDTPYHVHLH